MLPVSAHFLRPCQPGVFKRGHIHGNNQYFKLLSLWLLQTSSSTPSKVPGVVSSLVPQFFLPPVGFHDVFPSSSASAPMLAGWLPSEGAQIFLSSCLAFLVQSLPPTSESFLGIVNVSQAEAGQCSLLPFGSQKQGRIVSTPWLYFQMDNPLVLVHEVGRPWTNWETSNYIKTVILSSLSFLMKILTSIFQQTNICQLPERLRISAPEIELGTALGDPKYQYLCSTQG